MMENPSTISAGERSPRRPAVHAEAEPVLLALPSRPMESALASRDAGGEAFLEQLQVLATGSGPKVETALLLDLLSQSPGMDKGLVDPAELHGYPNPLAAINAYKHRLHALRCEFVNVRLSLHELETQLTQSRYRNEVLEKHVRFLDATLEEMRSSRAWKWVQKCSRWRRIVTAWCERLRQIARGSLHEK